jgi:hypothetical protein
VPNDPNDPNHPNDLVFPQFGELAANVTAYLRQLAIRSPARL